MSKIRGIKPTIWTDDKFVTLDPLARLLFLGMWGEACDNGHVEDSVVQLKIRLLPMDACNVADLLHQLLESGMVQRLEDCLKIKNLAKHQKVPDRRFLTLCAHCASDGSSRYTEADLLRTPGKRGPEKKNTAGKRSPDTPSTAGNPPPDAPNTSGSTTPDAGHPTSTRRAHGGQPASGPPPLDGDGDGDGDGDKPVVALGRGSGGRAAVASELATSTPASPPPAKRGTRLDPEAFTPSEASRKAIIADHPGLDLRREHARFVDYWTAKTGKDATKLDWDATWRNWMRRAGDQQPRNGSATSQRQRETDDLFARSMARAQAAEAAGLVRGELA